MEELYNETGNQMSMQVIRSNAANDTNLINPISRDVCSYFVST